MGETFEWVQLDSSAQESLPHTFQVALTQKVVSGRRGKGLIDRGGNRPGKAFP